MLLPYFNKNLRIIERNINQIISISYLSAKQRVIFLFGPILRPEGKDSISEYEKKYGSLTASMKIVMWE